MFIHNLTLESINQNFSVSFKFNQPLVFQKFQLVRNCRLVHIQNFCQIIDTKISERQSRQNSHSGRIRKTLKIKCKFIYRTLIWQKVFNLHSASFIQNQKFFLHTPPNNTFKFCFIINIVKNILPNKRRNLKRIFCRILFEKQNFCQKGGAYADITRIFMGIFAFYPEHSKQHKSCYKHKYFASFAARTFKHTKLQQQFQYTWIQQRLQQFLPLLQQSFQLKNQKIKFSTWFFYTKKYF